MMTGSTWISMSRLKMTKQGIIMNQKLMANNTMRCRKTTPSAAEALAQVGAGL